MRLNVTLNEALGVRIWSFPMRYQPTNRPDRGHIGENWSRFELRAMQIILQATHGIVSGEPDFFRRAFGETPESYRRLLLTPHDFIFNRDWYESLGGRAELDEYRSAFNKLSLSEIEELRRLVSSVDPRDFHQLPLETSSAQLKAVLRFYVPHPKEELTEIWAQQKGLASAASQIATSVPEDERVEDAGLEFTEDGQSVPIALGEFSQVAAA
jgi:hypothetical protein